MNTKTMTAIALIGTLSLIGCVSVDSLRQQVNSSDKNEVASAEMKIMSIIQHRNNFIDPKEYIALLKNNDLRLQLVTDQRYYADRVIVDAAVEGLSFSNEADAVGFIERNIKVERRDYSVLEMFKTALNKVSSEESLLRLYSLTSKNKDKFHYLIGKKLARITNNEKILCEIVEGGWYNAEDRSLAMSRITNEKILVHYYKKEMLQDVILTKISEAKIKQIIEQEKIDKALKNDITELEDDKMYFAAFKKAIKNVNDGKKQSLFDRACRMKDESLLIEFLTTYPDQAKDVATNRHYVKNSQLAELILDNLKGLSLKGSEWESTPGLDAVVYHAAKALDPTARAKYLKIADVNLAVAKRDADLLVFERYYIGMPVIDYVMRAFEEKHGWTKRDGAVVLCLDQYADMNTKISLDDWKNEWKIKYLVFPSKERSKIFKTKGTMDGFVEFLKKYVDKSATIKDITIEDGWWIYLDDPHGLKIALNDNNGALNIYRQ